MSFLTAIRKLRRSLAPRSRSDVEEELQPERGEIQISLLSSSPHFDCPSSVATFPLPWPGLEAAENGEPPACAGKRTRYAAVFTREPSA